MSIPRLEHDGVCGDVMVRRLQDFSALAAVAVATLVLTAGQVATALPAPNPRVDADEVIASIQTVDVSGFPEIIVDFTAHGVPTNRPLTREEVTITEDGAVRRTTDLLGVGNESIEVLIVMDRSGSMGSDMPTARAAAATFVSQLPDSVPVGVISFGGTVTVDAPLGAPRAAVLEAIAKIQHGGPTALYDAMAATAEQWSPIATRRIIVLLSDGGDSASTATLEEAVAATGGATVEVVELITSTSDTAALAALANPGPVSAFTAGAELEQAYRTIAAELLSSYQVRYISESPPGGVVRLAIQIGQAARPSSAVTLVIPGQATTPTTGLPPTTSLPNSAVSKGQAALDQTILLGAGFVMGGLGLTVVGFSVPSRRRMKKRLPPRRHPESFRDRKKNVSIDRLFASVVGNRDRWAAMERLLQQADVKQPINRFIAMVAAGTIGVLVLLGPSLGPFAIVVAAGVPFITRARLRSLVEKRRRLFVTQLPDTLQLLSSMLRSGYGFMQSIDAMARESASPTAEMFSRLLVEVQTGRDPTDAFDRLATEVQSVDFDWVVAAIEINREIGGDLAQTLDTVAETIRDREKLRGQVKALTAEGRMSAYLMLALPPIVGIFSFFSSPEVASVLFEPIGLLVLFIALALMGMGYMWIRSIVAKVAK
jgi:tight adherence protein B